MWIEKHRDEIHIPNQIEFGKPIVYYGSGLPSGGIMIAVDANDKHRVLTSKHRVLTRKTPPPSLPGHLNEAKSLEWLSENGYEVEKSLDGSTTIKKSGRTINIGHAKVIGLPLETGVSLTAFHGKIYIRVKSETE